jgi:hypothetical protein
MSTSSGENLAFSSTPQKNGRFPWISLMASTLLPGAISGRMTLAVELMGLILPCGMYSLLSYHDFSPGAKETRRKAE